MKQTHPPVVAYLDRLERLLDGASPETRAEVMVGVREHLEACLTTDAGPDEVRSVLSELGTPEQIADEAYAPAATRTTASNTPRVMERAWVPILVMTLSLLWLAAPAMTLSLSIVNARAAGHPLEILFLLVNFPVWPVVALLVGMSRLWIRAEKVRLISALPAVAGLGCLLLLAGLPPLPTTAVGLSAVLMAAWVTVKTGAKGLTRSH